MRCAPIVALHTTDTVCNKDSKTFIVVSFFYSAANREVPLSLLMQMCRQAANVNVDVVTKCVFALHRCMRACCCITTPFLFGDRFKHFHIRPCCILSVCKRSERMNRSKKEEQITAVAASDSIGFFRLFAFFECFHLVFAKSTKEDWCAFWGGFVQSEKKY